MVLSAARPGAAPLWAAFTRRRARGAGDPWLTRALTYLYAAGFGDVPRLPASLLRTGEAGSLTILGVALN